MSKEATAKEAAVEAEPPGPATEDTNAAVVVAVFPAQPVRVDATPAVATKAEAAALEDPGTSRARAKAEKAKAKAEAKAKANALRLPAPPWLTGEVLVDRLRLNSETLIDQLFAATLRQIQSEDQREGRLDAKAQGLLGTAGLSLTVAFTFGGMLLQHPDYVGEIGVRPWLMSVFYGGALALGLIASILALRALWVRGSKGISEHDVFNEVELLASDWDEGGGVTRYKRFMVAHIWQVYQTHADNNASKAGLVKWGQRFFVAFLVSLLLIGGGMAEAAFEKLLTPSKASASATKSPPPVQPTQVPPTPSRPPPTSVPSRGTPIEKGEPNVPIGEPGKAGGTR